MFGNEGNRCHEVERRVDRESTPKHEKNEAVRSRWSEK